MRLIEVSGKKINISKIMNDNLKFLHNLFDENGYEIRLIGGVVRDILMGVTPKDIDMATNATPDEMVELFTNNNVKYIPTGLQHGTITAVINNENYEITTLRIDAETDGRHAVVKFTHNWKLDAERRDLTFNAMSIDFDGILYDYFGGEEDLKNNVAKFVGDAEKRIQEDYLRILRYFRFKGRLNKPNFDKQTLVAIKNNASGLSKISGERIYAEMSKILVGHHVKEILETMSKCGIGEYIGLPIKNSIEDGYLSSLSNCKNVPALLASMLRSIDDAVSLTKRWKFPSVIRDEISFLVNQKYYPISVQDAKNFLVDGTPKSYIESLFILQGKQSQFENKLSNWKIPVFPLMGRDLKDSGINPGREFGDKMRFLRTEWKKSNFTLSKKDLINLVKKDERS